MDIPEVDVDALAVARDRGAQLLDVRQPDEFEEAHVPGAVLVPLGEVPDRIDDVPEGSPLYVICRSGGRSAKAVEFLREHGIDAVNVAGGTLAWLESGRTTAVGPEPG